MMIYIIQINKDLFLEIQKETQEDKAYEIENQYFC
jgi:hypothetical protein